MATVPPKIQPKPLVAPSKPEGPSFHAAQMEESVKVTATVPLSLMEKIRDYTYFQGPSQSDIVNEALALFFKDKNVPERPEHIRNKKKVGRKPKK